MPIYEYQCVDCGKREIRLAGLDDHTAICQNLVPRDDLNIPGIVPLAPCLGTMLRLNEDVFQPYFTEVTRQ